jgi:hypothetical protein
MLRTNAVISIAKGVKPDMNKGPKHASESVLFVPIVRLKLSDFKLPDQS